MRGKVVRGKMLRAYANPIRGDARSRDKSFEKWFVFHVGVA